MSRERCEKHGVTGCLACFRGYPPAMPMPTIQRVESVRDRMDPGDLPADLQAEMNTDPPEAIMNGDPPDSVKAFERHATMVQDDPLVAATLAFTNAKMEYEKAKIAQKAATEALVKATDDELQARADMNRALKALQAAVGTAEVATTEGA